MAKWRRGYVICKLKLSTRYISTKIHIFFFLLLRCKNDRAGKNYANKKRLLVNKENLFKKKGQQVNKGRGKGVGLFICGSLNSVVVNESSNALESRALSQTIRIIP